VLPVTYAVTLTFDLWPWTLVVDRASRDETLYQIWAKSNNPRPSYWPLTPPLSSDRQHPSYGDCLEVRGEIIRTVLCCTVCWKLCTAISTLRWAVLTVPWIGFCLTGPISLCVDSCVYVFLHCIVLLHMCCIIVTRCRGPDWSLILEHLPSVLWHCWLGHLIRKNPSLIWPMCSVGR